MPCSIASIAFMIPAIPLADSLWPRLGLIWYRAQHKIITHRAESSMIVVTHRSNVERCSLPPRSEKASNGRYFEWVSNRGTGAMTFKVTC